MSGAAWIPVSYGPSSPQLWLWRGRREEDREVKDTGRQGGEKETQQGI